MIIDIFVENSLRSIFGGLERKKAFAEGRRKTHNKKNQLEELNDIFMSSLVEKKEF